MPIICWRVARLRRPGVDFHAPAAVARHVERNHNLFDALALKKILATRELNTAIVVDAVVIIVAIADHSSAITHAPADH